MAAYRAKNLGLLRQPLPYEDRSEALKPLPLEMTPEARKPLATERRIGSKWNPVETPKDD